MANGTVIGAAQPPGRLVSVRERVLQAAGDLTDRFTVDKITMEDVSKAAGVARQTVYKNFASKDDLLAALFARRLVEHHRPGPLDGAEMVGLFLTELTLAARFTSHTGTLDPALAPDRAAALFDSPAIAECREGMWRSTLRRHREAGALRAELDDAAVIRWLTYNEVWILAHPTVLCDSTADLHRYVRDFVVGALVSSRPMTGGPGRARAAPISRREPTAG